MATLSGKSILVTGGAGFIGSHLVERLVVECPSRISVVDNLFLGQEPNLDPARRIFPNLTLYVADACDYAAMKRILKEQQVDVVYDLAVVPLPASLTKPRWTVDSNVKMTTVLCELLREREYDTLVHFSSSEAYGSAQYVPMDERHPLGPTTPYAASKAAGDHIVLSYRKTFGLDAAILRPFNNYGPRQNEAAYAGLVPTVVQRALNKEAITIFGDGEQTRDFVFVRDVADAAVRVYQEPATRGQVINIASGQETSVNTLVREILVALGSDARITHVAPRAGDVRRHCGGVQLARDLIAFTPATSLHDGLRETVAWCRAHRLPKENDRG